MERRRLVQFRQSSWRAIVILVNITLLQEMARGRKVVTYVLVQSHLPNRNQWELLMWPDLGDIKHRPTIPLSLMRFHDLDIKAPGWIISTSNCTKQLLSMEVRVCTRKSRSFVGRYIAHALQRTEMEFAVFEGSIRSDELEGMYAKGCYATNGGWETTRAEEVN